VAADPYRGDWFHGGCHMVGSTGPGWPGRTLLGELPDEIRAEFLRLGTLRRFARGQVILVAQARSTEVYVILRGSVRVVTETVAGEQAVLAMRTQGELVGEFAAMDGEPRIATVIAAGTVVARVIDGRRFREFTDAHPDFRQALERSVLAKLRAGVRLRAGTGQVTVLTKVSRAIEHLAELYGRPITNGVLVDIPLPQRDLASLVGTSPKGVGRAYHVLRNAGGIDVDYRRVIVRDANVVRRFAEGAAA
jgi:CRP/FNR family transcriptional regulator, cyclic AMP receptor protein